jgi:hypothetical protein
VKRLLSVAVLGSLFVVSVFAANQKATPAPDVVHAVVTVLNSRSTTAPPPALAKEDVIVRQNGQVRPVLEWQPLTGAQGGMDVAILIDDSLESSLGLQWGDVTQFIRELPANSRVAVVRGFHSDATISQPFTTDRELASKALRLPLGQINEGSSIYLSLVDLLNRWPGDRNRRVVLLISDGVDIFYGIRESEPGLNMNLQRAIDAAQKKGVIVDTIFASGSARFTHNLFLINNGQSSLARLALETGGADYTSGFQTPVSFAPFLRQITGSFAHQYLLTFRAALGPKAGFARLQLGAEQSGVELRGPSRVYLPAAR